MNLNDTLCFYRWLKFELFFLFHVLLQAEEISVPVKKTGMCFCKII